MYSARQRFAMRCVCHLSGGVHTGTLPEGECEYIGMCTPHLYTFESLHSHVDVQCLCSSHLSLFVRLKSIAKGRHFSIRMVAEPSADGLHFHCVLASTLPGRSYVSFWGRFRFCSQRSGYHGGRGAAADA